MGTEREYVSRNLYGMNFEIKRQNEESNSIISINLSLTDPYKLKKIIKKEREYVLRNLYGMNFEIKRQNEESNSIIYQ